MSEEMKEVDKNTIIKERKQDDYLDTEVRMPNDERKLIRELVEKNRIPVCNLHDEPVNMIYDKEEDWFNCPYPDCDNKSYFRYMSPPPR